MGIKMSLLRLLAIGVPILIAVGGWFFTYFHKRKTDAKAAQLERINQQLRYLYGPLYARVRAGNVAWNAFVSNYWPKHGQIAFFAKGHETTEEEKACWRLWMKEVFEPNNKAIEEAIVSYLDLLDEEEFPDSFLNTLAHVNSYRAVMKKWEEGDFDEHLSVCNYPAKELIARTEPKRFYGGMLSRIKMK